MKTQLMIMVGGSVWDPCLFTMRRQLKEERTDTNGSNITISWEVTLTSGILNGSIKKKFIYSNLFDRRQAGIYYSDYSVENDWRANRHVNQRVSEMAHEGNLFCADLTTAPSSTDTCIRSVS